MTTIRFDHAWVACTQTCSHVQTCCGLVCTRRCGTRHTHSCSCIQEKVVPDRDQPDLLIDFGQSSAEGKPVDGKANGSAVVNESSGKIKFISTPESGKTFAKEAGNSAYFDALHKARQASSKGEPRAGRLDETFASVQISSSSSRGSPVDVSSECSPVALESADRSAAGQVPHTGHLLD